MMMMMVVVCSRLQSLARKGDRNEVLLMRDLQDHPQDPYLWFQLAKEHQARGHPPQAALCFTEALRLAPTEVPWRHSLVVRAITLCARASAESRCGMPSRAELRPFSTALRCSQEATRSSGTAASVNT